MAIAEGPKRKPHQTARLRARKKQTFADEDQGETKEGCIGHQRIGRGFDKEKCCKLDNVEDNCSEPNAVSGANLLAQISHHAAIHGNSHDKIENRAKRRDA